MQIDKPLIKCTILKRYKRFLADVKLQDGEILTVHCPNSGSMKTCIAPGWSAIISDSQNEKRKLRYTLEMTHNGQTWIGVNTMLPNKVAREGIEKIFIPELSDYETIKPEQKYGRNSRIDLLLERNNERCYVEVKNVTLVENGIYYFPDAITERGQKHLDELTKLSKSGIRAVMLFTIQRSDGSLFKPAVHIDPVYAEKLYIAEKSGVEILPYVVHVSPVALTIHHKVPYEL